MKAQYDSAVAAATKPLTDKYIDVLKKLRDKATMARDLQAALFYDTQIKAGEPVPENDWKNELTTINWLWGGNYLFTFLANGTISSDKALRWTETKRYTITYTSGPDTQGSIIFDRRMDSAKVKEFNSGKLTETILTKAP